MPSCNSSTNIKSQTWFTCRAEAQVYWNLVDAVCVTDSSRSLRTRDTVQTSQSTLFNLTMTWQWLQKLRRLQVSWLHLLPIPAQTLHPCVTLLLLLILFFFFLKISPQTFNSLRPSEKAFIKISHSAVWALVSPGSQNSCQRCWMRFRSGTSAAKSSLPNSEDCFVSLWRSFGALEQKADTVQWIVFVLIQTGVSLGIIKIMT